MGVTEMESYYTYDTHYDDSHYENYIGDTSKDEGHSYESLSDKTTKKDDTHHYKSLVDAKDKSKESPGADWSGIQEKSVKYITKMNIVLFFIGLGFCLVLMFFLGRLTSSCSTVATESFSATTFSSPSTPSSTTFFPPSTKTLGLIDAVKICKKTTSNLCLGLTQDGRITFEDSKNDQDKTIHWRFRKKPGVPSSPENSGSRRDFSIKGYIENLSNCMMLDLGDDLQLKVSDRNDNSQKQVWLMDQVEQENWYDDLFFKFKNEQFANNDPPIVLEAKGNNFMMRGYNRTNYDQQFIIEESLDIMSPCEIIRSRGIQPFSTRNRE